MAETIFSEMSRLALDYPARRVDVVFERCQRILDDRDIVTAAGQVIDIRMIVVQQILLYEVKMITAGGVVSNLYFIAQNGQQVAVY